MAVLDLRTGRQRILVRGGSHAHYVATGHLVYGAGGTLRAVAFDLARLEVVGTPVPVVPQMMTTARLRAPPISMWLKTARLCTCPVASAEPDKRNGYSRG